MNILIVGCGRVGSKLATLLDFEGHQVQIVDSNEENFTALPDKLRRFTTPGIPIDQDILKAANIRSCDAVAAVTPNDNTNIMIGQLAKEIFNVPTVLVRVSDPQLENTFSDFGLETICPTNLTVAAVNSAVTDLEEIKSQTVQIGTKTLSFIVKTAEKEQIGILLSDFEIEENQRIYGILQTDNKFKLYHKNQSHNKQLRITKGDKVVITTFVD